MRASHYRPMLLMFVRPTQLLLKARTYIAEPSAVLAGRAVLIAFNLLKSNASSGGKHQSN